MALKVIESILREGWQATLQVKQVSFYFPLTRPWYTVVCSAFPMNPNWAAGRGLNWRSRAIFSPTPPPVPTPFKMVPCYWLNFSSTSLWEKTILAIDRLSLSARQRIQESPWNIWLTSRKGLRYFAKNGKISSLFDFQLQTHAVSKTCITASSWHRNVFVTLIPFIPTVLPFYAKARYWQLNLEQQDPASRDHFI